jgi:hypothetical protein
VETQPLVEGFRAMLARVVGHRQPIVSAPHSFPAQLFDSESSIALALVVGSDVEPPQVAVEQRVLMVGGERSHDKAHQLIAVVDHPRPGDVRHRVSVSEGPGDGSHETVLIGPQLERARSPDVVLRDRLQP